MIAPDRLAPLLAGHLARQRWFGGKDRAPGPVAVRDLEVLRREWPALLRVVAEVTPGGEDGSAEHWQLLLGARPPGAGAVPAQGEQSSVGRVATDQGPAVLYDATVDPELALLLLPLVAPGRSAARARLLGVEQSHTSIVYDDAVILKVFRRLTPGANPEVEVAERLAAEGFTAVPTPLASWRRDGTDCALLSRFLPDAADGWTLARRSVRSGDAGFVAEAADLGRVTAGMHLALARAFPTEPASGGRWAAPMHDQLARVLGDDPESAALLDRARAVVDRLGVIPQAGRAIRAHGDYHLGQVIRSPEGWFVLDFEGEPARPPAERARPTSPLRDVAGMLRSFSYAAAVDLVEQGEQGEAPDQASLGRARAWERRHREAFLGAWLRRLDGTGLVPADPVVRSATLAAFELDKAVYELAYERAHRVGWVTIPMDALRELTGAAPAGVLP